jgi:hypothetical protein
MIAYSVDAEPARAYLLRSYNDIDIFIEDAACQNMYVRLFSRMLAGKARINHVFPLQSKKNVIERCASDQDVRPRKRLYIIDADQDLILGLRAPRLKHLYRLKVYCSENLLLSEHAAITIGMESKSSMPWPDMALALAIRPLLTQSSNLLLPLFIAYAIVLMLDLPIETVRYSVRRLLTDVSDPMSLSERLVRIRIISIIRLIRGHVSGKKYRSTRDFVSRQVTKRRLDSDVYLSGKTYLLPLLHLQLQRRAAFNDSFDGLKVRLAQHCELTIDSGLQRAIRKALRA